MDAKMLTQKTQPKKKYYSQFEKIDLLFLIIIIII